MHIENKFDQQPSECPNVLHHPFLLSQLLRLILTCFKQQPARQKGPLIIQQWIFITGPARVQSLELESKSSKVAAGRNSWNMKLMKPLLFTNKHLRMFKKGCHHPFRGLIQYMPPENQADSAIVFFVGNTLASWEKHWICCCSIRKMMSWAIPFVISFVYTVYTHMMHIHALWYYIGCAGLFPCYKDTTGRTDDNKATHMSVAVRSKSTSETFRNNHTNSHIVNMYVEYYQSTQHIYCLFVIFFVANRAQQNLSCQPLHCPAGPASIVNLLVVNL